jgi:hypothetical protein
LAALTVLSLLWMPLRLRRRGAYGRKGSAALRSLHAPLLGLGGWFVGALIALTTLPTLPLDDEVLALVSIGIPVALGIYWAWVRGDWSATTKTGGFVAAIGGAIVGAWLGLNATAGLLAVITTIAGATAGANLMLIVLDMTWQRSTRSRFASDAEATAAARHRGADSAAALPRTEPWVPPDKSRRA